MTQIRSLLPYEDDRGNKIISKGHSGSGISVTFTGSNNTIYVPQNARIGKLIANFDGDNGHLELGNNTNVGPMKAIIRIGEDSRVYFSDNVSTTEQCVISAVEGSMISFGNDVMIASNNEFRADDGHPIFDINSGLRVNPAKDIVIGDHVWFARGACALGGAKVGEGSVIGFGSLVTGDIPNNVEAAGQPAKVVRKNIAWERPHLSLTSPPYKPNASSITKSPYWNRTRQANEPA